MTEINHSEIWFLTGSQHLYGDEALKAVKSNARNIVATLNQTLQLTVKIVFKPIVTLPEEVYNLCLEANQNDDCIGVINWMHTFSPAKMWIAGLKVLSKPFVHLHTQFNRDIPWDSIDMDFMNLNQSAHGGREFGFIGTRLRIDRTVIVGHYKDPEVCTRLETWIRAAKAWKESQGMKIARFGDNMRNVAVTEGDKVSAQIKFGYEVQGYGVGDLSKCIGDVTDASVNALIDSYRTVYEGVDSVLQENPKALKDAARIEIGMKTFLEEGNFKAFTTTFEDLNGIKQLPGLAVQHLMEEGYGFGAEGDWKTAALVRSMKVMAEGLDGGTSFMEDYTYHFEPGNNLVLGAHMLEVCPSIAGTRPRMEVHPLSIGGKDDPARVTFNVHSGNAVNASIIDLGNRFRMVINPVHVVETPPLPKLPVARVAWKPEPDLKTAAQAWILAGGAHHTGFSKAISCEHLEIFAEMAGIESVAIDKKTIIPEFKKELRWNELYHHLMKEF